MTNNSILSGLLDSSPFVAAGDNLNIPLVGSFLRKMGAFYIRRKPKEDHELYTSKSDSCKDCPIGTAQDQTDQAVCDECEAGYVSEEEGNSFCTACGAGKYSTSGAALAPVVIPASSAPVGHRQAVMVSQSSASSGDSILH